MRRSRADKEKTHSRIIAVAAKRFREEGLEGIGVADVMKEAGSTVGGFYKHFGSRDDLVIEALAEAFKDLDKLEQAAEDLPMMLRQYLGEEHSENPGAGCAVTALVGDVRHASTGTRTVFTQRVKHDLQYYEDRFKPGDPKSRRARAILVLSACVGGLNLARAVNDKGLSREILSALREEVTAVAMRPIPRGSVALGRPAAKTMHKRASVKK